MFTVRISHQFLFTVLGAKEDYRLEQTLNILLKRFIQ